MGATSGADRLYKTVTTILIESSALHAITFLLFIGPWGARSFVQYIPLQILAHTQVSPVLFVLPVLDG
jgi:hypothetical protein